MKSMILSIVCSFIILIPRASASVLCSGPFIMNAQVEIALPQTVAQMASVHWSLDGQPIEDQKGRTLELGYAPWESGTYALLATDDSGMELCRVTVDLPARTLTRVDGIETLPPEMDKSATLLSFGPLPMGSSKTKTADKSPSYIGGSARESRTPVSGARSTLIKVYYASERSAVAGTMVAFTGNRSSDAALHYGFATVAVPSLHKRLFVKSPKFWTFSASAFSASYSPLLSRESFYESLSARVLAADPSVKQVFVFVHGFNNGFEEDIFKTAQLAYDTGFNGVPIMFDWPTMPLSTAQELNPTTLIAGYVSDRGQVDLSVDHLADFLRDLSKNTGAVTVNVVAHSMGNRLLLLALKQLSKMGQMPQLGQVIMAAPDVDEDLLKQIMPSLLASGTIKRVTIYGSEKDRAMLLSQHANHRNPIGFMPPVVALNGIDAVDASPLPMNFLGHDYFLTTEPVLGDMSHLLAWPSEPPPRPGLVPATQGDYQYWRFSGHAAQ